MKIELTEVMLASLRPPVSGRAEYQDNRVPELWLRVTAADRRTWSVLARVHGKQVRPTIGTYPEVKITEARRRAREMLGKIQAGIDPTAEKRKIAALRVQQKTEPRIRDRLEQWREAKERDWSQRYAAEVKRLAEKMVIPALGSRLLRETTRADWVGLAETLRKRSPAQAHWVYSLCSSFLNHAEAAGWGSGDWVNPLPRRGRGKIAPAVAARERVLSDDELARIWQASMALRPKPRAFVRLLIMTGCRVSEAAKVAIGEIDTLRGWWRIPAERAKNGTAITLPLHSLLGDELAIVWPKHRAGHGHRLLGSVEGSGLQAPSKVKMQVDRRLDGMAPWVWHDLRRSMRSGLARLGVDKDLAELCLNHISHRPALVRTYDRHDYSAEILAAVQKWQNHVAGILRQAQGNSLDITVTRG